MVAGKHIYGESKDHRKKHRNYKAEDKNYEDTPEQIKHRESRNKARRQMVKAGKARKGDGLDLGHRNGNPMDDRKDLSNYKMETKHENRSYARDSKAHKVDPRS